MDAAGQLAQLAERERELLLRAVDQLVGPVGIRVELALGEPQRERERDEPLLGAVVQVALQPPALLRAGLDDARAGGAQLLDAGAQLGLQPLVLHRQAGGGRDRAQQVGLLGQRHVVQDRADAPVLEHDLGPRAHRIAVRRQLDRMAVGVDPLALVLEPEDEIERAVAERVGQPAAQRAGAGRLAERQQQLGHGPGATRRDCGRG